jgi:hypothetical protein
MRGFRRVGFPAAAAAVAAILIQARYPAYREAIFSLIDKEKAAKIIEKAEELLLWLKVQIL